MGVRRGVSEQLRQFFPTVYAKYGPLNARQYAYRAEAAGIISKTESKFILANMILTRLRENGVIPWSAVLDSSRSFEGFALDADPDTFFKDAIDRLKGAADEYHLPIWSNQDILPIIITEKIGMVPYFERIANDNEVSVYAIKGQVGKSHLHESFIPYLDEAGDREIRILYLGDYDDEGFQIQETLDETLAEFGATVDIQRLALTGQLVTGQHIRLDPVNRNSTIAGKYVKGKAEIEALDPEVLKRIIGDAIRDCLDAKKNEERVCRERKQIERLRRRFKKINEVIR